MRRDIKRFLDTQVERYKEGTIQTTDKVQVEPFPVSVLEAFEVVSRKQPSNQGLYDPIMFKRVVLEPRADMLFASTVVGTSLGGAILGTSLGGPIGTVVGGTTGYIIAVTSNKKKSN